MTSFFRLGTPPDAMETYTVSGRWQSRDGWQPLAEIEAENENVAGEQACADSGSRHGLGLTRVEIGDIRAVAEVEA